MELGLWDNTVHVHITVLFDALQIPAGMLQFHWILLDSTRMEPDSRGIDTFLQEWDQNSNFLSLYSVTF